MHMCKLCYVGLILTLYFELKMNVHETAVLELFVCLFLFVVCLGSRESVLA